MSMIIIKRILIIALVILLLAAIRNGFLSIVNSTKEEGAKERLEKELLERQREGQFLKEKLFYVKTDEFVEEEAKEKLGMLKSGEILVIAPTAGSVDKDEIFIDTRPIWQKWWDLFF